MEPNADKPRRRFAASLQDQIQLPLLSLIKLIWTHCTVPDLCHCSFMYHSNRCGPPPAAPAVLWGGVEPDTETHWPPRGFDFCVILIWAERAEESLRPCLRAADHPLLRPVVQLCPAFRNCNRRAKDWGGIRLPFCVWTLLTREVFLTSTFIQHTSCWPQPNTEGIYVRGASIFLSNE